MTDYLEFTLALDDGLSGLPGITWNLSGLPGITWNLSGLSGITWNYLDYLTIVLETIVYCS